MNFTTLPRIERRTLGIVATACISLYGCGSADEDTSPSPDAISDQTPNAATERGAETFEPLHEFAGDGYAFTFGLLGKNEALGDPGNIVIRDGFDTHDRLSALKEKHGSLTSLETFLAFAPEGQEPHPALTAAHADEARAFGRTDLTVLRLDGRLIDKAVMPIADCTGQRLYPFITPLAYTSQESISVTIPSTTIFLCSGSPLKQGFGTPTGCVSFPTTKYQVAVACRGARGVEPSSAWFHVNNIGGQFPPEILTRLTYTRLQLLPTATPGLRGNAVGVSIRNGPSTENISMLFTGVGSL